MKRRFVSALLASVAAATVVAPEGAARAQEIQLTGPLKGAPAVRRLRLYRKGRLEISPSASFTLLDEYRRTILFGGTVNYGITDWLAIGAWGGYGAVTYPTALANEIDTYAPRDPLTATQVNHSTFPSGGVASFNAQTARINYMVSPQLTFIPFRGKLAIFNKIFVDADLYAAAGPAFVGIQERKDCGGANELTCNDPNSFALGSQTKITGTFGVGFRFYPAGFWSIGVEYRAVPFSWNRAGFDTRGAGPNGNYPTVSPATITSQDDTFRWNQLITVSIGFYFPTSPWLSD